ncbi:hypothetical protein HHK36_017184 [Tetracentron sinense]|uniref:Uncharacterized protein n=1 Tax=Tetracentron sinense TaxID=13715 RepID=A0A834Z7G4_TETSI|nr:hypothetical protein HHK36_017184 [Tetracentron sinense]
MARDSCLARVTTGVAVGGAVGGAVGAVYGAYEAIRYKTGLLAVRHYSVTEMIAVVSAVCTSCNCRQQRLSPLSKECFYLLATAMSYHGNNLSSLGLCKEYSCTNAQRSLGVLTFLCIFLVKDPLQGPVVACGMPEMAMIVAITDPSFLLGRLLDWCGDLDKRSCDCLVALYGSVSEAPKILIETFNTGFSGLGVDSKSINKPWHAPWLSQQPVMLREGVPNATVGVLAIVVAVAAIVRDILSKVPARPWDSEPDLQQVVELSLVAYLPSMHTSRDGYGVPGLMKIRYIGQTTLGSAAIFGLFLGAGSLIHCGKSY